jgi:outer membrane protein
VTDRDAIPSRRRGPASPVTSMPDILARRLAAALLAAALALPGLAAEPSASARPLTLDDALALAARQSRDLALARADAGLADADALSAFSGVLPRLDLTGSGGRQFLGPTTVTAAFPVIDFAAQRVSFVQQAVPVPSTDYEAYSLGLRLQQPLLAPSTWSQIGQARATSRAAARTYDEARLAVAFDVTRRFYELLKATRSLGVLQRAAARSEELVGRSEALFAAGRVPKSDALAARVNLGNDRIAVEQARTRLVQARTELAVALGQPGDWPVEVVAPAALEGPALPAGEPAPLAALLETARARRPSLAVAAAQIEAADAAVGVANSGWFPSLIAQLTYDRNGTTASGRAAVFDDFGRQYTATAQLVLSWNLFAGGATRAAGQHARLAADRVRATAGKVADVAAREVATARQAVLALTRQVALSSENLGSAEQGLALARQRLEAGLASQLEVRDATLKLTQAELTLVQARIDHAVAAADLNRAVGGAL